MIGNQRRGGVILCRCHGQNSDSIDLEAVGRFLGEALPGAPVAIADDLCHDTTPVARIIKNGGLTCPPGLGRRACLAVGACGEKGVAARVRRRASQNGLDPYSVSLVALRERCAQVHPYDEGTEKAKLLMASGLRRSLAFPGTQPRNLRPRLGGGNGGMSRRSLLSLAFIQQQVIPHVETRFCLAWRGCRNCLSSCPVKALSVAEGRLVIDSERCRGCGLCTVSCPVNALRLPTATVEEVDEAMGGLLQGVGLGPRVLLLTCSGTSWVVDGLAGTEYPAAVLPLEMPCLGMASSFVLLRALELGAWGVGILPCNGKCDYGFSCQHLEKRVEQVNQVARSLGLGEHRISIMAPGEREAVVEGLKELVSHIEGAGPHRMVGRKAAPLGDEGPSLGLLICRMSQGLAVGQVSLPYAEDFPLGRVAVDPARCIACGVCAANCPTGALRVREDEGVFRLTFSHVSCVACQLCLKVCPQRPSALNVEGGLDLGRLGQPPEVLHEEAMTRCQSCGDAFTSPGVARRVQEAMARRGGLLNSDYVTSLCPRCRLSGGILAQSLKKNLVAAAPSVLSH